MWRKRSWRQNMVHLALHKDCCRGGTASMALSEVFWTPTQSKNRSSRHTDELFPTCLFPIPFLSMSIIYFPPLLSHLIFLSTFLFFSPLLPDVAPCPFLIYLSVTQSIPPSLLPTPLCSVLFKVDLSWCPCLSVGGSDESVTLPE